MKPMIDVSRSKIVPLVVAVLVSIMALGMISSIALAQDKSGGGGGGDAKGTIEQTALDIKNLALNDIDDLQTSKRVMKAYKYVLRSTDDSYWADGNHLNPENGKKVYDMGRTAVRHLEKACDPKKAHYIGSDNCDTVNGVILPDLLESDRIIAQTIYDEAVASDGNANKLNKASKHITKAEGQVASNDFSKAVKSFKKAWKNSLKSMGLM